MIACHLEVEAHIEVTIMKKIKKILLHRGELQLPLEQFISLLLQSLELRNLSIMTYNKSMRSPRMNSVN